MRTNKSSRPRTESSVKVRCKLLRVNSMLPQGVKKHECEARCFSFMRTRSILILHMRFNPLTWTYTPNLTITKKYSRKRSSSDRWRLVGSKLVPSYSQCNCVCCDERAPGNDGDFLWRSASKFLSLKYNAYTCYMQEYVNAAVSQHHSHFGHGATWSITDNPSPKWAPYYLHCRDLKLRTRVGGASTHSIVVQNIPSLRQLELWKEKKPAQIPRLFEI